MYLSSREGTPVKGGAAHDFHPAMEIGHVWLVSPGCVAEGSDLGTPIASTVNYWLVVVDEPRPVSLHEERDIPCHPFGYRELG